MLSAQLDRDQLLFFDFNGNMTSKFSGLVMTNYGSAFGADRKNQSDSSIVFDQNGFISSPSDTANVDFPITVSYWMKLNSINDVNIFFRTDNVQNNHYGIWMNNLNSGGMTISFGGGLGIANSTNARYFTTDPSDVSIEANKWHHIVGIIRSFDDMEIYIDCKKVSGTYGGTGFTNVKYSTTGDFRIGGATSYQGVDMNIDGSLDDFGFWTRVLEDEEIKSFCKTVDPINSNLLPISRQSSRKLERIVNLLGQDVPFSRNEVLIYIYSDGSVERKFFID